MNIKFNYLVAKAEKFVASTVKDNMYENTILQKSVLIRTG